ncbi:restriction endonuclease subunit S [Zoogloea sp. 1C4]|uniref:restriction endonuclease subunit S n=1 Tax=Zoogloea sp. 1C4 TaxID=2570190 RepID=UPI00129097DE|nr:restriction endonuclease subunit S [Zoogloea sp. 1C4]
MRELPSGWCQTTLDSVVDVLDFEREPINSSERESRVSGKSERDLYPYYGATGQVGLIDSYRSEGQRVLLGEDAAPFLDPVKDKAYLANGRFWVNNHAHVLAGAGGLIDNRFLCHQLNVVDYRPFVTGSTRLKLTSAAMRQLPLFVAPVGEQTRIVAKLEELLSDLDAGVAELKAAQKKLAQYRQSLLKAAVSGDLTAEWRQRNRPTETGAQLLERILAERRARWEAGQLAKFEAQGKTPPKDWQKKYPEPVQSDTAELPELPEGWAWARIEQMGAVQLGRQRAPQFHTGPNMVPYLRVANVFEERIDVSDVMEMHFSEEDEAAFKLAAGDVLLNEGQSLEWVGRPAIFRGELPRACFTNTLVRFRAESGVLAEYALAVFLHYMHSGKFRKIAKITTNIAHLGAGRFGTLEFPLPSVEEQLEIVRVLRELTDEAQRQGAAIALALKQSSTQLQNILRAAFSGQLVPQDPNDEPASALLERIRDQRGAQAGAKKPRGRKAKETSHA